MAGRTQALLEKRNQHVPPGPFNTTPAFVKEARGAVMVDVDGNGVFTDAGDTSQTFTDPADARQTIELSVDHSADTISSVITFGFQQAAIDLAIIGMPGCHLYVSHEFAPRTLPITNRIARWDFTIPQKAGCTSGCGCG